MTQANSLRTKLLVKRLQSSAQKAEGFAQSLQKNSQPSAAVVQNIAANLKKFAQQLS
jgi:hypothetical protein